VISRVADHCFWFGRYVERAESTARLLQTTRTLVFDADLPVTQCWQPLIIVAGERERFAEKFGAEAAGDGERVQEYLTWDVENGVSLLAAVQAARRCGRAIRDVLSLETWEAMNELYHFIGSDAAQRLYRENREELYRTVRRSTQLVLGLVRSTMMHDEPMSFLWLGVMLERVGQVARLLDMHHHMIDAEGAAQDSHEQPHDIVQVALWLSLLRACSGAEEFMKKRQGRVSAQALVSFLVFEPSFPRSLRYCLKSARSTLGGIWPDPLHERPSVVALDALIEWLKALEVPAESANVHELLMHIVDQTSEICGHVAAEIQGPPHVPAPPSTTPPQ
jgi:uncharacterized alpha-E superfamily protein